MKDLTNTSWTDEAKVKLRLEQEAADGLTDQKLIMAALAAILEEQYRTCDRSPGSPPLRDRALQWALEERAKMEGAHYPHDIVEDD